MKIKSPLKFIQKSGLIEFEIKEVNGARFIIASGFKQLIKSSEYKEIIENTVVDDSLPFPETPAPRKGRK